MNLQVSGKNTSEYPALDTKTFFMNTYTLYQHCSDIKKNMKRISQETYSRILPITISKVMFWITTASQNIYQASMIRFRFF